MPDNNYRSLHFSNIDLFLTRIIIGLQGGNGSVDHNAFIQDSGGILLNNQWVEISRFLWESCCFPGSGLRQTELLPRISENIQIQNS